MEHFSAVYKLDLTEETRTQVHATQLQEEREGSCLFLPHTSYACVVHICVSYCNLFVFYVFVYLHGE